MFKDFKLSVSLPGLIKDAGEFFLGSKEKLYDPFGDLTDKTIGDRSGGFLDTALSLGKAGFKAYQKMAQSDDGLTPTREFERPNIQRFNRGTEAQVSAPGQSRWRPQNAFYREAILRRMQQINFESDLQRLTESTTVRPTATRKRPTSVEPATIKRTTAAPRLKP
jgi:hypothetical protein